MTDKKSARMRIDMALIVKIRKRLDNFELNTDIPFSDNMWYCLYGRFVFF